MTLESIDVDEFVADLDRRISRLVHDTGLTLSSAPRTATGCTMVVDRKLMMQACTALAIARLRQADVGDSMSVFAACVNDAILIGIDSSHAIAPTRAVRWSRDNSDAVLFVIDSLLCEMNGRVVIRDNGGERGVPLIRITK